jgi:dipeptidyl aminopeptidase/acylaminoacyl peptidase
MQQNHGGCNGYEEAGLLRTIQVVAAAVAALSAAQSVASPPTPLIPLEDFARGPAVAAVQISPDGQQLAQIETIEGRGSIVLKSRSTGQSITLARNAARSIDNVAWSGDGQLLYYLQDAGGDEGYHLFRLDPAQPKQAPRDLTPFKGASVGLVRQAAHGSSSVIITLDRRDPQWPDAYRLDLGDGTLTELVRNNGKITDYFADQTGRVAAAESIRPDGFLDVLAPAANGDWHVIYTAAPDERFKSFEVEPTGSRLFARSNRNAARDELVTIDLSMGRVQRISTPECGIHDVEDVFVANGSIAAIACTTEARTLIGRSPSAKRAIAGARRLVGKTAPLSLESRDRSGQRLVLYADPSNRAGQFVLADSNDAKILASTRPWLDGLQLAVTRPYWLRVRDGLPLLAYVTRPVDIKRAGPTVVALHGGPWSRDAGGFESTTQMLANRGYTVIQLNFRGSTGMGKKTFEGGVREFARKMSDDVDDVVRWAIDKKFSDHDRVCLMGGSYGGFAVLSGLTRQSFPYRCGIDFAGPVDLQTLMTAFPPSWSSFLPRSWYRFVGRPDVEADLQEMRLRSPLTYVDRLNAPLLIFQGANDPRVTQAQSDAIVCAGRSRKITIDYLLAGNEGHSFANEETSLAVNRATELFLAQHLGGRAQSHFDPKAEAALSAFRKAGDAIDCTKSGGPRQSSSP